MNYVNNWSRPVNLAIGATALELDLLDGEYRLTLADSAVEPSRWEIIGAVVVSGIATLTRGQEGTLEQNWPVGCIIYNAVTAGTLSETDSRLNALEQRSGGAVVSDSRPDATPAYTGQLHIRERFGSYVALASECPEDWALFAGAEEGFGYFLGPDAPGVVYQLPRHVRRIQLTAEPGSLPQGFPVTFEIPLWQGNPHGWSLMVEAGDISLSLDFSALGDELTCNYSDYGTATTAAIVGSVLTLQNNQQIAISFTGFQPFEGGTYCGIEVRAHTAPLVSFLSSE